MTDGGMKYQIDAASRVASLEGVQLDGERWKRGGGDLVQRLLSIHMK
jgi:hypothetical protein